MLYLSEEDGRTACTPLLIDEIFCFVDGDIQYAMEKIRRHDLLRLLTFHVVEDPATKNPPRNLGHQPKPQGFLPGDHMISKFLLALAINRAQVYAQILDNQYL